MLAGLINSPELALDESEAKRLATAAEKVGRHYNAVLSGKALDWSQLIFACGAIYGPRIAAIRLRIMTNKASQKRAPSNGAGGNYTPTFRPQDATE